jgi:hypothetical protein
MPERVVALAERRPVLFRRKRIHVQTMRRRKVVPPR